MPTSTGSYSGSMSPQAASVLKTMLAMPPHELHMRPIGLPHWHQYATAGIDDGADAIRVVRLPRHHDAHVVIQPDQAPIKHPMCGAGKRQPIADNIGAVGLYWSDMRGLDLGPSAAIDELQSGDSATFVIGTQNDPSEHAITNDTGDDGRHSLACLIEDKRHALVADEGIDGRRIRAWQKWGIVGQASFDDAIEVARRQAANSGLRSIGPLSSANGTGVAKSR